jgi:creatinine amidohydrolase
MKRFFFFSGHGPNAQPIADVVWNLKREHGVRCANLQFNAFLRSFAEDLCKTEFPFGHAGEAETCIMLHWRPDLVNMEKARAKPTSAERKTPGIDLFEDLEFDYGFMSDSGHMGDPTPATADAGAKMEERMLDYLEKLIRGRLG